MKTNKETLEESNDAIRLGNYDHILNFCQEDTKWVFLGDRTLEGKAAVRSYMEEAYLAPSEFTQQLLADGDFVIATGEMTPPPALLRQ